mmetsp:Transcript_12511/g.12592  ORF Transcript_12511/g.12592 Transcript_12511/m.12592 type:complete len:227 (-) Transcript_12511:15-695(-)
MMLDSSSPALTMWQLSFSDISEKDAKELQKSKESDILQEALRRTTGWFDPVQELIRQTVLGETWCTPLYDRDPMRQWRRDQGSRVTLLGDACHPMSMFKGQGANQALEDGTLLASWICKATNNSKDSRDGRTNVNMLKLSRETLLTRLRCYEREMISRTTPKVLASRIAAAHLHSSLVLRDEFGIEGLTIEQSKRLLEKLEIEGIDAHSGKELQTQVCDVYYRDIM